MNSCKELGIDIIQQSDFAYLTTIDNSGYPSTRAVFNLRNLRKFPKLKKYMTHYKDTCTLFFTTNTSSSKVRNIIANPKVSVYFCDSNKFKGFMCQGDIEIINDKSVKDALWHDEWIMYYPDGGKDSEDYSILKLEPNYIKSYYQLQLLEEKI